jgi:hypothetical protein
MWVTVSRNLSSVVTGCSISFTEYGYHNLSSCYLFISIPYGRWCQRLPYIETRSQTSEIPTKSSGSKSQCLTGSDPSLRWYHQLYYIINMLMPVRLHTFIDIESDAQG